MRKPNLVETEGRTDAANADRLIDRHADDIRYIETWDKWLGWDGKRFKASKTDIQERMKYTAAEMWDDLEEAKRFIAESDELDLKEQEALVKSITSFVRASNNFTALRNAVAVAASDPAVAIEHTALDSHPLLFNVLNGTIDLRTLKLRPHRRGDLLTQLCQVEYDENANAPRWRQFIREVTCGDDDLAAYLQKLVGFSLTGMTDTHILPVVYGTGANGKSVFFTTIMDLLGDDYAAKANVELLLAKKGSHPTELTILHNRRFVACIEADEGRRLAEAQLKEITGGDRITARRMREDFWQFDPTAKVWLATNHKPRVRGDDNGIWRRLRLVPFDAVIPPENRDRELPAKLRQEVRGILNWALFGCYAYLTHGLLPEPQRVQDATREYRSENDLVGQFLDECTVDAPTATVKASDLYDAYAKWSEAQRERPLSKRALGTRLDSLEIEKEHKNYGWIRLGIGLLASTESYSE